MTSLTTGKAGRGGLQCAQDKRKEMWWTISVMVSTWRTKLRGGKSISREKNIYFELSCHPLHKSLYSELLKDWNAAFYELCWLALVPYYLENESVVTQSCSTLCDPMDCRLPSSSIHGILQARILEGVFPAQRSNLVKLDLLQVDSWPFEPPTYRLLPLFYCLWKNEEKRGDKLYFEFYMNEY